MRLMTEKEMGTAVDLGNWATICTLGRDMGPYAVEATYFINGPQLCFMINPRGTTMKNIGRCPKVVLKITLASLDLETWMGVSCFGTGRVENNPDRMTRGWELLGRVMGADYAAAAEKYSKPGKPSPMLVVDVEKRTGRCSHRKGESIDFSPWQPG